MSLINKIQGRTGVHKPCFVGERQFKIQAQSSSFYPPIFGDKSLMNSRVDIHYQHLISGTTFLEGHGRQCYGTFFTLGTFILCKAGRINQSFFIAFLLICELWCTSDWTPSSLGGLCSDPMCCQQNDHRYESFYHAIWELHFGFSEWHTCASFGWPFGISQLDTCQMYSFSRRYFANLPLQIVPLLSRNFSPHIATRIGEALNPGPTLTSESYQNKLVFVNPTAVNKKVSTLLELKPDIITLAETSATLLVQ